MASLRASLGAPNPLKSLIFLRFLVIFDVRPSLLYFAVSFFMVGHLSVILGPLGAILGPSWALLGPSWGALGPSWGVLGALLGPLRALLEASWALLGPSWATFGPSWSILVVFGANLGPSWPHLGPSWDHFGAILVRLGIVFEPSFDPLWLRWESLRAPSVASKHTLII